MMEWLEMGGYAAYVWPVFGIALIFVIVVALTPRFQHKRLIDALRIELEIESEN